MSHMDHFYGASASYLKVESFTKKRQEPPSFSFCVPQKRKWQWEWVKDDKMFILTHFSSSDLPLVLCTFLMNSYLFCNTWVTHLALYAFCAFVYLFLDTHFQHSTLYMTSSFINKAISNRKKTCPGLHCQIPADKGQIIDFFFNNLYFYVFYHYILCIPPHSLERWCTVSKGLWLNKWTRIKIIMLSESNKFYLYRCMYCILSILLML